MEVEFYIKTIKAGTLETLGRCSRCGAIRDDWEICSNFEMCDECFNENCPCNDANPQSCPLHRYPDVVLEFVSVEYLDLRPSIDN